MSEITLSENYSRANTSADPTPGGTGGWGNGWIDVAGNSCKILGNKGYVAAYGTLPAQGVNRIIRPSGEAIKNVRVTIVFDNLGSSGQMLRLLLRCQGSSGAAY